MSTNNKNLKLTYLYLIVLAVFSAIYMYLIIEPVNTSPTDLPHSSRPEYKAKLAGNLPHKPLAHYRSITQRPVFSKTRQPPAKKVAKKTKKVIRPIVRSTSQPVNHLRLLGVLINSNARKALIQNSPGSKATWFIEGQNIRGWKLISITHDKATLKAYGRTREIKLYELPNSLQK